MTAIVKNDVVELGVIVVSSSRSCGVSPWTPAAFSVAAAMGVVWALCAADATFCCTTELDTCAAGFRMDEIELPPTFTWEVAS